MDEPGSEDIVDPSIGEDIVNSDDIITVAVEEETVITDQDDQGIVQDIPQYIIIAEDGVSTFYNSIPVLSVPTTSSNIGETGDKDKNGEVYFLNCRLVLAQPDSNFESSDVLLVKKDSINDSNKEVQKSSKSALKSSRPYKCSEAGCERSYSTLQCLKVHSAGHRWRRGYPCTVSGCNKVFSSQYGRKAHVRIHTGERPYKCSYFFCGKAFNTSGDLQKHIRIHTGVRPFKCKIGDCNKAFTTGNILQIHMRSHTGERPYVCDSPGCNRKFASSTNYKNHMRIHSGEKPFSCKVEGCGKSFTEYSSLYKHNAVHNQQARFQCSFCNKSYRQEAPFLRHMKASHIATVIAQSIPAEAVVTDETSSPIQLLTEIKDDQKESPFYIIKSDDYHSKIAVVDEPLTSDLPTSQNSWEMTEVCMRLQ